MSEVKGLRFNQGKPRWDLVPPDAMSEVVEVFTIGAEKYLPRNWENGLKWMDTFACLQRHLYAWQMGQEFDVGPNGEYGPNDDPNLHMRWTGKRHLAMVCWNALVLLTMQIRGIGFDDRPKLWVKGWLPAEDEVWVNSVQNTSAPNQQQLSRPDLPSLGDFLSSVPGRLKRWLGSALS